MPSDPGSSPLPDGVDGGVAALIRELQAELRRVGEPADERERSVVRRHAARDLAERYWAVSAERPIRGNPVSGAVKKVLRKLMRWYVEPLAYDQRLFNDSILKLVDELAAEVDRLAATNGGREGRPSAGEDPVDQAGRPAET